jgi:hypothetical protein
MDKSFIKTIWKLDHKTYYFLELQGSCNEQNLMARQYIYLDLTLVFDQNLVNWLWKSEKVHERYGPLNSVYTPIIPAHAQAFQKFRFNQQQNFSAKNNLCQETLFFEIRHSNFLSRNSKSRLFK